MVPLQLVHGSSFGRHGGVLPMVASSGKLDTLSSRSSLKHVSSSYSMPFLPSRSKCAVSCSKQYTCNIQRGNRCRTTGCRSLPVVLPCTAEPQRNSNLSMSCNDKQLSSNSISISGCLSPGRQQATKCSSMSTCSESLEEPQQHFAAGASFGMAAGMRVCGQLQAFRRAAAAAECNWGRLSTPWGLTGSSGLQLPHRFRRPRAVDLRTRAFAGAAASASGVSWHQAVGLTFRGVMWGIVFTLGAQLLLVLLLRTIWVQRAVAALESWLQAVFGVSLRNGRASFSTQSSMEDESDDEDALSVRSNGSSRSRSSSRSSSSSSGSIGSSNYDSSSAENGTTGESAIYGSSRSSRRRKQGERAAARAAFVHNAPGENVEWVNMCFRKIWRVYQRGLERWITDLLQPVFDALINPSTQPGWLLRLRIVELTLDHEAPCFSNMRRRNSRKDSDLTGVVDLRYTGGARLLLMLELGQGRWRFKIPVLVSDLDVQCALWLKLRLAPMCPWIGTISLAFVGPPAVKVQLSPYNRVRLMRIPVLQNLLNRLLTVDLPALMVLPERLEISVPPSVTSIAEAAVGRDTIMRAVASAVLQVDSLEQALLAALPLGPQGAAGGVSLPDLFRGELTVLLRGGRDLPVWGMPWQSNPWVRLVLGEQAVASRRDSETSTASRHGAPVWNQEVQFLVEDPEKQVLEVFVNDSHLTGRPKVGKAVFLLKDLPPDGRLSLWLPLEPVNAGQRPQGEVHLELTYKVFEDDDQDSGFREAQEYAKAVQQQSEAITDIRSAAAASSRAAVAASAAISAIAMTKAAAARAAARAAQAAKDAGTAVANTAAAVSGQQVQQGTQQQVDQQSAEGPLLLPPPGQSSASLTNKQREAQAAAAAAAATAAVAAGTSGASGPAVAKARKGRSRDQDRGGGGDGTSGPPAAGGTAAAEAVSAAADVGEDVEAVVAAAAEAAAAARRREEALIEALEARMAFRVRSTSSTPKPVHAPAAPAAPAPMSSNGKSAAAIDEDVKSPNMTVTLPADSLSDSDETDEEVKAAERAQKAVVDILEKSKRMEAAVAELAALSAGSPTEAALQQGAIKAAADAVVALSAFQASSSATTSSTTSSSSGGGGAYPAVTAGAPAATAAAAKAVSTTAGRGAGGSSWGSGNNSSGNAGVADRTGQPPSSSSSSSSTGDWDGGSSLPGGVNGSINGTANRSSSHGKLNGSSSDHASSYSIWGEESPPWSVQQSYSGPPSPSEAHVPSPGQVSEYSIWGEHVHVEQQQQQQQQQQPASPCIVVRVKDGEQVLSEVVGCSLDKAVQTDSASSADKAVQTSAAGSTAAEEEKQPWWASIVFSLPGQKRPGQDAAAAAAAVVDNSSKDQAEDETVGHEPPELHAAVTMPEPISTAQRAWWQPLVDNDFVKSLPGIAPNTGSIKQQQQQQQDAAQAGVDAVVSETAQQHGGSKPQEEQQKKNQRNWWDIDLPWFKGSSSGDDVDAAEGIEVITDGANKPVEAIVIPADLPLEEIAKEVAKLKEDAWKSKEDHLENLWAKTVERNDRSWIMLLCFLLTVVIGLLSVVAWRISGLASGETPSPESVEGTVAAVEQVPLMLLGLAAAAAAHYGMWP